MLRRYLLFLNAPDVFAKRFGATDPDVVGHLRGWAAGERVQIARLREVQRSARQLAKQLENAPDTEIEQMLSDRARNLREERRLIRDLAEQKTVRKRSHEVEAAFRKAFPEHTQLRWPRLNQVITEGLALLEKRAGLSSEIRARMTLSGLLAICRRPMCDRVWSLPRATGRPPEYCPSCRRRWSAQQLWRQTRKGKVNP